jgi:hypothetical protein
MRKTTTLAIVSIALLASGCQEWDWDNRKTIDLQQVQLTVPENWRKETAQGYDAEVGKITNGKETLAYDYGWYSYTFTKETTDTHHRTATTIDGRPALIVQPKQKGRGVIGLFVQVDSLHRFTLIGRDIKNEKKVLSIFRSVKVK